MVLFPLLFVLGTLVVLPSVLALELSLTVKSRFVAWPKAEAYASELATNAMAAAGMQATIRDRAEAQLEMDGLNLVRISGGLVFIRG